VSNGYFENAKFTGSIFAGTLYAGSSGILSIQNPIRQADEDSAREWSAHSGLAALGQGICPKATHPLSGISFLVLELILLGSGAVTLFAIAKPTLGWVSATVAVLNKVLLVLEKQYTISFVRGSYHIFPES
jgi:hypothetical protein